LPEEFPILAMSVTPTNPDLGSLADIGRPGPDPTPHLETHTENAGRNALEALLAFSALHQQIQMRRQRGSQNADERGPEDSGQLEQFVLDEVLQLVAERALKITGADGVAIALAEEGAIVCRASAGNVAPDHGMSVDPNSGFSGACLISSQIVRCDDTESDPRVNPHACRTLGARSMVAVPLSAKRTVVGLLEAFCTETYGFNDSDVRSLSLLAELILAAMRPEEEDRLAEVAQRIVGQQGSLSPAPQLATLESDARRDELQGEIPGQANSTTVPLQNEAVGNRTPGLGIVVAVVLFALILGVGLWWGMRLSHSNPAVRQTVPPAVQPTMPPSESASVAAPSNHEATVTEEQDLGKPASATQLAAFPQVTGIRHWSSADSSTVVIDLQDQVQYEAHRLTNPDRIYFDLHDTRLLPELSGKNFEVGDSLIGRVRVAQPIPGITRVVLETKGASNFSVSLEINPYRLSVEVRKIGSQPEARSRIDLFAPLKNSAAGSGTQARALAPRLRIVLDAGHGGWDLGTVGRQGLLEKDLALDIVSRLGMLVQRRLGAEVVYTRTDDSYIALEKRTEIANLSQADFFLSVHANYSDYPSARGVETYYTNTYSSIKARPHEAEPELQNIKWATVDIREKVRESHRLAASVQHALYATLAKQNPDLPNRGVKEAQYAVLTGTTMPAILAEISFVSSPRDESNLQSSSYRQQVAEALYKGVAQYAEQSKRAKLASTLANPGHAKN
jgi:N-acetylmuramoyl-L-alanine amidase/putative methionine-R-sulfoxide reductase with GAF domain